MAFWTLLIVACSVTEFVPPRCRPDFPFKCIRIRSGRGTPAPRLFPFCGGVRSIYCTSTSQLLQLYATMFLCVRKALHRIVRRSGAFVGVDYRRFLRVQCSPRSGPLTAGCATLGRLFAAACTNDRSHVFTAAAVPHRRHSAFRPLRMLGTHDAAQWVNGRFPRFAAGATPHLRQTACPPIWIASRRVPLRAA